MSRATMQMMYNGLFVNSVSVDGKIFCKEPMKKNNIDGSRWLYEHIFYCIVNVCLSKIPPVEFPIILMLK